MPDTSKQAQIPGKYVNDTGDDFVAPLAALLMGVGLLGENNKDSKEGLNELKEGALGVSKWLGAFAGGAGILGVGTAIVSAFTAAQEPTRVALIVGGSLIGAAAAIALALVVQGDVRARAASAVAQYEARSTTSAAFLSLSSSVLRVPAEQAANGSSSLLYAFARPPRKLRVKAKDHANGMRVTGVRRTPGGELQVRLEDGDWVPESDVETFEVSA